MTSTRNKVFCVTCLMTIFFLEIAEARKRKYSKRKDLQSRETNVFDFVRLLILRLVYGFASAMGFGESMSQFLGGIFVPPGVEEDYGDFDY